MKILFPIYRFNWYRVVAPVVDAFLKAGHDVVCLHNESSDNFASNRPDESMFPKFENGRPSIDHYRTNEELDEKVFSFDGDTIASIDLPLKKWINDSRWEKRKFRYVAITTTDTLKRLHAKKDIDAVDLFCVRTEWEMLSCIQDHCKDYREILEKLIKKGKDGKKFYRLVEERIGHEWDSNTEELFRSKVKITGFPLIEASKLIHRNEVINRWNLDPTRPIIGLWSTPVSGRGYHGNYDWVFDEKKPIKYLAKSLHAYGLGSLMNLIVNEDRCIRAIRKFADKNNAQLVIKARHYQDLVGSSYEKCADLVVGEESYYPHTALELSAIADLMIGFRTSGYPDAVFVNTPVLNIEIPNDPLPLVFEILHFWKDLCHFPGISKSMTAKKVIQELPHTNLDTFQLDDNEKESYLKRYATPTNGGICDRIVRGVETLLGNI